MRRIRYERYIALTNVSVFERSPGETSRQHLLRVDTHFYNLCSSAESHKDEPTQIAALHLKELKSYLRCTQGVRAQDFWLLEKEGVDWLPPYKIGGKKNYVTETLHGIDTMYGPQQWMWPGCGAWIGD